MKEWFILELLEMMKALDVVPCSIVFVLLCNLGRHGEVLKVKRNGQF